MVPSTKQIRDRAAAYMVVSFILGTSLFIGAMWLEWNGYHGTAVMWCIMGIFSVIIYWKNMRLYRRMDDK